MTDVRLDVENEGNGSGELSPLEEVGNQLRTARVAADQAVSQVSASLRIPEKYIDAMERGAFEELPGHVHMVGYARSYATYLKISADPIAVAVNRECLLFERGMPSAGPLILPERNFPAVLAVGISAVLLFGLYYGWQRYMDLPEGVSEQQTTNVPPSSELPNVSEDAQVANTPSSPSPSVTSSAGRDPAALSVPVITSSPAVSQVFPPEPVLDSVSAPRPVLAPATAPGILPSESAPGGPVPSPLQSVPTSAPTPAPTPAPAPGILPSESIPGVQAVVAPDVGSQNATSSQSSALSPSGVVIEAQADSWIQVNRRDGQVLISRILRTGDRYAVPQESGLRLISGNVAGIVIWIGNEKLPSIGNPGQVVRDISLDPEELREKFQ